LVLNFDFMGFIHIPFKIVKKNFIVTSVVKEYPNTEITIFGSAVATALFQEYPNVEKIILDESKKASSRIKWIYKKSKEMGKFDVALTFRKSLFSRLFIWLIHAKTKGYYKRYTKEVSHQVIYYNNFVNKIFQLKRTPKDLKIYFKPFNYEKPTLGINAGAAYGSAKRWYPEKFTQVAKELNQEYNIVIFGGDSEIDISSSIENELKKSNIFCKNFVGKTDIKELCQYIGGLTLFITGDSGPMHIAAAFKVPTVAIFGPTNHKETSQWMNPNGAIVQKETDCSPCMKRTCPLGHHECMKLLEVEDVLRAIKR